MITIDKAMTVFYASSKRFIFLSTMNQEQLNQRFYLNRVDHNELLSLLQFHFGQSSHPALSRRHTFTKRDEEQISLDVEVDKYGQIFDIIPSQDFPDIELEAISSKIRNTLIDNQSIKIGEVVGFSVNGKVDGFFKYKEEFQILPVPDSAPKITHQTAGDHPFLLQFKYATCPDFQISSMRAKEKEIRILRMLNLLTKGRIKHVSPFVKSAWVAKIDDDPSKWTSQHLQETYFYKSAIGDGTSFTDLSGLCKPLLQLSLTDDPKESSDQSGLQDRGSGKSLDEVGAMFSTAFGSPLAVA